MEPECQSLSCLELGHPGGSTTARLSRHFDGIASTLAGADHLEGPAHLAVDLRWEPMEVGEVAFGAARVAGVDDHSLVMVVTEEDDGMWELDPGAVDAIRRALRRRDPPDTLADLLAVTDV